MKLLNEKDRDFGAAKAYFGTAEADDTDGGLLIKAALMASKTRCSHENCNDPSCPPRHFCQAFMEWLEQRFSDDDRLSIEAIRNIYIDPEEVDGTTLPFAEHQLAGEPEKQLKNIEGGSGDPSKDAADAIIKSIQGMAEMPKDESDDEKDELEEAAKIKWQQDVMHKKANMKAEVEAIAIRRPLRMTAVGTMQPLTAADKRFIQKALDDDFEVAYQQRNPKMKGSEPEGKESWRLYEKFKAAKTLKEALILGAEMKRIKDDYAKGFIRFPGRESIEPGHVFMADSEEASDLLSLLGINYDLHVGRVLRREEDDAFAFALESAEKAAEGVSAGARKRFNEIIAACHDPVQTIKFLEDKKARMAFAEQYGLRLMATTSAATFLNIDYDLSPEPDYKGSLEENGCPEWREWREAREEELAAMRKFGVYRIVSRSEARGHKLLTSKWVHKRKTNGIQGTAPDETFDVVAEMRQERNRRFRIPLPLCNREFTVHFRMYASGHCGGSRYIGETQSNARNGTRKSSKKAHPVRV